MDMDTPTTTTTTTDYGVAAALWGPNWAPRMQETPLEETPADYRPQSSEEFVHIQHRGGRRKKMPDDVIVIHIRKIPELEQMRPVGRKVKGATQTAMGFCEFVSLLLWNNELLPKYRKLTDKMLKGIICREYPTSKMGKSLQNGKLCMGTIRSHYNRGYFTRNIVPQVKSYRYTDHGERANIRTGRPVKVNQGLLNSGRKRDRRWSPDGSPLDPRLKYGPAVDGAYDGSEGSDYM